MSWVDDFLVDPGERLITFIRNSGVSTFNRHSREMAHYLTRQRDGRWEVTANRRHIVAIRESDDLLVVIDWVDGVVTHAHPPPLLPERERRYLSRPHLRYSEDRYRSDMTFALDYAYSRQEIVSATRVELVPQRGIEAEGLAVTKLLATIGVVADALTLQLAASLSLRPWYEYPRQFVRGSSGWMGLCAAHGYVRSARSGVGGFGQCSTCLAVTQRSRQIEWSVDWLSALIFCLIKIKVECRRRAAEEALPSLILQIGAVWWASLDDFTKRVCLLEDAVPGHDLRGGADVVESVVPDSPAVTGLLELD